MAHKLSAIMIAAFATLTVASLFAVGASAAMVGPGTDLTANGNGDCDRTMDKLHSEDCTCDGTGPQVSLLDVTQDRLQDGSCLVV